MAFLDSSGHVTNQAFGNINIDQQHIYHHSTEEEGKCLQALLPKGLDYELQKNQNPLRAPGTCLWTLENPKYINWRDLRTNRLLWISAGPGCGKSVLARWIIDDDLPRNFYDGSQSRVCYFFFKDTSPDQRSATRAISSLLHQLFRLERRLIQHALPSFRSFGESLSTNFSELWRIFEAAAADPLADKTIFVFDALDECNESEQTHLIKSLRSLILHLRESAAKSNSKFLFTSRPYYPIRREFDSLLKLAENIELAGDDESAQIKKEIDLVIKSLVADLASENCLSQKVTDHLQQRLLETPHRTYLWLHLVWEIIQTDLPGNRRDMNKRIDNLPSDINDSYEKLLKRCRDIEFTRKVFQIVLAAYRPLTLDEIDFALHADKKCLSSAEIDLEGAMSLQARLHTRCGLMISIVDQKVYFIHHTVKEFLLERSEDRTSKRRTWQHSFNLERSHDLLAQVCKWSIRLSKVQPDRASLLDAVLPLADRNMRPKANYQRCHFMSYSAIYWADHGCDSESHNMELFEYIFESSIFRSVHGWYPEGAESVLTAASAAGNTNVVGLLLGGKKSDVNATGDIYGTALIAASRGGHEEIVVLLLKNGADTNIDYDGPVGTALVAALFRGHEQIVHLLLQYGACHSTAGRKYLNDTLRRASGEGDGQFVRLCLKYRAEFALGEIGISAALIEASRKGKDHIVRLFIEYDADLSREARSTAALAKASPNGQQRIVQLVQEHKANANLETAYSTPSVMAFNKSRGEIRQLLLGSRANPRFMETWLHTAWTAASDKGDVQATRLLFEVLDPVERGVGADHKQIVRLLLDKGADVDLTNAFCQDSPLVAASGHGHEQIVQLLLDHGADINGTKGSYRYNPLATASRYGHEQIVRILLDRGAHVNSNESRIKLTPLAIAIRQGHEQIVRLLLDHGADINGTKGSYPYNPLKVAIYHGHEQIARLLLDKGADINATRGSYSDTPLRVAILCGHEKIVQLLLNKGADVNLRPDHCQYTPLAIAMNRGYEQIVRLLLDYGADIGLLWRGSPLTASDLASLWGKDRIIQMLEEHQRRLDERIPA